MREISCRGGCPARPIRPAAVSARPKSGSSKTDSREFLAALRTALQQGDDDTSKPAFAAVRDLLSQLSSSRARSGSTPVETAMFVFSLKEPLFARMRRNAPNGEALADEIAGATVLLDRLGLFTMEAFQKTREESSHASSRSFWSYPRRSSGCGTTSSRCR